MSSSRRFLVIVRAGDDSLHERWLGAGERNWDLVVSYGGEHPDRFCRPDAIRIDTTGSKWPALRELLGSDVLDWRAYDYVWLAQGDVITNADDVSRMFGICSGLDLWLAHPALTRDSPTPHPITLRNEHFGLRFTNFVENTAPVFQTRFLQAVLPSLQLNDSGGGFDYLWPRLVDDTSRRCAVIDSVPMQRMRPMSGAVRFEGAPMTAEIEDAAQLMSAFGIGEASEINLGALMRSGERYSLFDDSADAFVGRILRGMVGVAAGPAALGQVFLMHERARRAGPLSVQSLAPAQSSQPVQSSGAAQTKVRLQQAEMETFEPTSAAPGQLSAADMESLAAVRRLAMSLRRTNLRQPA